VFRFLSKPTFSWNSASSAARRAGLDSFNRREIHNPWDIKESLIRYLDPNPHRALRSRDPVHKALAIIDRRVGYRSLTELKIAPG
jgi:hypothetical protein